MLVQAFVHFLIHRPQPGPSNAPPLFTLLPSSFPFPPPPPSPLHTPTGCCSVFKGNLISLLKSLLISPHTHSLHEVPLHCTPTSPTASWLLLWRVRNFCVLSVTAIRPMVLNLWRGRVDSREGFQQFLETFLTVRIWEGVLLASRMLLNIPQCAGERTPTTN